MKSNLAKNCRQIAFILISASLLSGCISTMLGRPLLGGPGYVEWEEEVKLNDGRVIVVTQKKKCSEAYTGQNWATCIARESWVTINLPEFSDKPIVWHEHLKASVLNIHNGHLYIVARFPTELEFRQYGAPQPPYVGYVFGAGEWEKIPFSEIPKEIYNVNMLIEGIPPKGTKYLSIQRKDSKEINGDPVYRTYQKKIIPTHKW